MFQGQYLFFPDSFYSPWVERQGDNLRHSVDLLSNPDGATLLVQVYHKNSEDAGPGSPSSGDISTSTIGRSTAESVGLKELVRFRFTCQGEAKWFLAFRTLPIVWFDDVGA